MELLRNGSTFSRMVSILHENGDFCNIYAILCFWKLYQTMQCCGRMIIPVKMLSWSCKDHLSISLFVNVCQRFHLGVRQTYAKLQKSCLNFEKLSNVMVQRTKQILQATCFCGTFMMFFEVWPEKWMKYFTERWNLSVPGSTTDLRQGQVKHAYMRWSIWLWMAQECRSPFLFRSNTWILTWV